MRKWKKSFRKIPEKIQQDINLIPTQNIQVLAGKKINRNVVGDGEYEHLGLLAHDLNVGRHWDLIPANNIGRFSKKNQEGWEDVRKDLPKYVKYYYQDIPIYGDGARNGWTTAVIPREVYHREHNPPYFFQLNVSVQDMIDENTYGLVFSIDQVFDRESTSFDDDVLFALNLLQENTGVSGVVSADNPEFVFTTALDWTVFPPGELGEIAHRIIEGNPRGISVDTVRERLKLFEQFSPIEYLQGLGGNNSYIGAKFAEDLVAFENLHYGNALYVMYGDWQVLSRLPRSELLKLPHSDFDRIVHSEGWEVKFAALMQQELQDRGMRVRIGRHVRHRRR